MRTLPAGTYKRCASGDYSILESYLGALRSAERLVYLENQFLWSPEVVDILADKLAHPPSDDFRIVVLLPARANDGADISRGQVAALIEADEGDDRFLACTVYAREGKLRDIVYVHAKVGIVDDRWLTIGSANLNAHSLLNDTEMNVVTPRRGSPARRASGSGPSISSATRTPSAATRRPWSTSSGGRSPRSSCTGSSTASRSRTGSCGYPASRAGAAGCSARCRATSTTCRLCSRGLRRAPSSAHARRPCRLLDRRAEVEEPAAEHDRAEREPAPAEREAADDVGQPVDAEQHAAARRPRRSRRRRPPDEERADRGRVAGRARAQPRRRTPPRSRSGRSGTTARASRRRDRTPAGRGRARSLTVLTSSDLADEHGEEERRGIQRSACGRRRRRTTTSASAITTWAVPRSVTSCSPRGRDGVGGRSPIAGDRVVDADCVAGTSA